jgi:two-component SAPR family response regulator
MNEIEVHKRLFFCIVVDDEPLAQQVIQNYIDRISELKLVAKCESVEEAFTVLKSVSVDIVFLDLDLKTINGTDLIAKMRHLDDRKYYIIITSAVSPQKRPTFDHDNNVVLIDYLTKPFSFDIFQKSVRKIFSI